MIIKKNTVQYPLNMVSGAMPSYGGSYLRQATGPDPCIGFCFLELPYCPFPSFVHDKRLLSQKLVF